MCHRYWRYQEHLSEVAFSESGDPKPGILIHTIKRRADHRERTDSKGGIARVPALSRDSRAQGGRGGFPIWIHPYRTAHRHHRVGHFGCDRGLLPLGCDRSEPAAACNSDAKTVQTAVSAYNAEKRRLPGRLQQPDHDRCHGHGPYLHSGPMATVTQRLRDRQRQRDGRTNLPPPPPATNYDRPLARLFAQALAKHHCIGTLKTARPLRPGASTFITAIDRRGTS